VCFCELPTRLGLPSIYSGGGEHTHRLVLDLAYHVGFVAGLEQRIPSDVDYPHVDSTWPDTREIAMELMSGLDEATLYKVVRGNAITMLSLDLEKEHKHGAA
jgi:hypothetical protein